MKRLLFIPIVFLLICTAWAGPPASPPVDVDSLISTHNSDTTAVHGQADMDNPVFDSVTVGDPISVINTEYPVWEAVDSNGDVVASATVECSVITDGSQVCQIHYYVMSDTPGTLTEEFTVDVNSD